MDKDLETFKSQIGFKTAFKATMGFYTAQFIATILGLITIVTFFFVACLVAKWLFG